MTKTVVTPKGTILPLTNLKGREYLMVAYRLQWFNETETNFTINTEFLKLESDYAIARAAVTIYDKDGRPVKMATATKREDRKDFPDFMEKSETSAVGRALAILGYGTQFAIADLDEGDRLADSPLASPSKSSKPVETSVAAPTTPTLVATKSEVTNDALSLEHTATTVITKKATASSFRKPKKAEANKEAVDGWE